MLVAGFQGFSRDTMEITTLGRGGTDATAVALAAALGAACEIYSDVPGVFTADPRLVPNARKLPTVSYEEMLEMSASGAKVLMLRSVELARNHGVRIHARSTFSDEEGTWVQEGDPMEQPIVSAVTHSENDVVFTLSDIPDRPGVAALIFDVVAAAQVNVDTIIQNVVHGNAEMSFSVPAEDVPATQAALDGTRDELGAFTVEENHDLGKVSLIGAGMRSHPGVAAKMFRTLADNGVNLQMISTSPIKISCMIARSEIPNAVRELHAAFELESEPDLRSSCPEAGSARSPPNHASDGSLGQQRQGGADRRHRHRRDRCGPVRARADLRPVRAAAAAARPDGRRAPPDDVQLRPADDRLHPRHRRRAGASSRSTTSPRSSPRRSWHRAPCWRCSPGWPSAPRSRTWARACSSSFTQPLRLGDRITVGGETGFVEDMALIYTTLVTDDARRIFIPNTQLTTNMIVNRTIKDPRRAITGRFPVSIDTPIPEAREVLLGAIADLPGTHAEHARVTSARSATAPSGSRQPPTGRSTRMSSRSRASSASAGSWRCGSAVSWRAERASAGFEPPQQGNAEPRAGIPHLVTTAARRTSPASRSARRCPETPLVLRPRRRRERSCRGRTVEADEEQRARLSEQSRERARRWARCRPECCDSTRRVDHGRLPRPFDDGGDDRPGIRARHQDETSTGEVDFRLARPVDFDGTVHPADPRMEAVEGATQAEGDEPM